MLHPMTKKKNELKEKGNHIRTLKQSRKGGLSADTLAGIEYEIWRSKRDFRHEHIAYSLVRGRSYEEIENPKDDNKPNWDIINKLYKTLKERVDAANEEWRNSHE